MQSIIIVAAIELDVSRRCCWCCYWCIIFNEYFRSLHRAIHFSSIISSSSSMSSQLQQRWNFIDFVDMTHFIFKSNSDGASSRMPLGDYPIYSIRHYRSQVIWNGMLKEAERNETKTKMRKGDRRNINWIEKKKRWTIAKQKNVIRWQ